MDPGRVRKDPVDRVRSADRPAARRRRGMRAAAGLALLLGLACAHRPRPEPLPPSVAGRPEVDLRRNCPAQFAARTRIHFAPEDGPGVTLDGNLQLILPDTVALSARLGVFRPVFALRADADSAELLLHDTRRYWVSARGDEDWGAINPSAWARALAWALCPADLYDRLDAIAPAGGDEQVRIVQGRLRASPYRVQLALERQRSRLVRLRFLVGDTLVLELRPQGFRRHGSAWIPEVVDLRAPRPGLSARIEIIGGTTSRPDRPPAVERLRPPGWAPVGLGDSLLPLFEPGDDPG